MKWRVLGSVVALAALAWSGWWFFSATLREEALSAWLQTRRDAGWQADVAEISTGGFPNRIDTRLVKPALADPTQGWAWSAPFLDILTLTYEPNAAILAFAPAQELSVPGARATLTSERLRASIRFVPGASLALSRMSLSGEGLRLAGSGWVTGAASAEAHLRRSEDAPAAAPAADGAAPNWPYDLYVNAESVTLPESLRKQIDVADALPPIAERLRLDAVAALDAPLDRSALEDEPPGVASVTVKTFEARWGELGLTASGALIADAQGYASGTLQVRAENWRAMLLAAVKAGALDQATADMLETGLGLLARLSGDGDVLSAPLSFSGGRARLGPIPIGPAPLLRPRA